MAKFLASDTFEFFLLEEAVITTSTVFSIDGHQVRDFYTKKEWESYYFTPFYENVNRDGIVLVCHTISLKPF